MANAVRIFLVVIYTIIIGPPLILISLVPGTESIWMLLAQRWFDWIAATFAIEIIPEGLENVPRNTPFVLMSNHQSLFDIVALARTLPVRWRFVAKKELVRIPIFGWILLTTRQIIIDRGDNERAVTSLRRAAERVRSGTNVIIFPEGTRSPDGTLRSFKSGGFHLALQAQVPILPVTVSGSQRAARKKSLDVRSGSIKIRYGKPIPTRGLGDDDRHQLKNRVREAIAQGYDPQFQGLPQIDPPLGC